MEYIQRLSDKIDDEIDDAIEYAEMAMDFREDYPAVADAIIKISDEEMKHMNILHGLVVSIIEAYRKDKGEPPELMKAIYKATHKKQIAHAAEAKAYQSMYKE